MNKSYALPGANIIGSHGLYRRKDHGTVKTKIVPWVHRDPARYDLCCDLSCLNPDTCCLILSIGAETGWLIAQMDAEAAFLQVRGFLGQVFVRPPKEASDPHALWLLLAAAYGLDDNGRLWYRTNDDALSKIYKLARSKFEPTIYYHKDWNGNLDFVLVVQVDNYLDCGTNSELSRFENLLQSHFKIGMLERRTFPVLAFELTQADHNAIAVSQCTRAAGVDTNVLASVSGKAEKDRVATTKEVSAYRSVIGQLLYRAPD